MFWYRGLLAQNYWHLTCVLLYYDTAIQDAKILMRIKIYAPWTTPAQLESFVTWVIILLEDSISSWRRQKPCKRVQLIYSYLQIIYSFCHLSTTTLEKQRWPWECPWKNNISITNLVWATLPRRDWAIDQLAHGIPGHN